VRGVVVVAVVLAAASLFMAWRRRTDGKLRVVSDRADEPDGEVLTTSQLNAPLGERATLVQFSSAFCAPCRTTRVVLDDVASRLPGVAHVEVDAEANLDLVRQLDVRRTPTVLVLDERGRIRTRASGAPSRSDVIAALGQFL
jgi:thiol-disulfide isomerase/thioredoxin